MNREIKPPPSKKRLPRSARFSIPFFSVMALLTVVAMILPLRPTQSYSEKRALAEFPAFSAEALLSGSYFDDINLWFSDTFPGREGWVSFAQSVKELHGFSDVVIHGELPVRNDPPAVPPVPETQTLSRPVPAEEPDLPAERPKTELGSGYSTLSGTAVSVAALAASPVSENGRPVREENGPEPPAVTAAPEAPVEEWGGVDAGEGADIILDTLIQIDNFAFSYFGFNQYWSDFHADMVSALAAQLAERGTRVISALIPTSVGVMVESVYLDKLNCADHAEVIDYMYARMGSGVVTADVLGKLLEHNDEYIYFRTDHHWTARGAYYAYAAICEALGMEAAALEDFEEWDQGELLGTFYWSCNQSSRLEADNVYAYDPPGDLEMFITEADNYAFPWPVLTDMSHASSSAKYMVFLAGDHPLTTITNHDIEEDSSCLVIKDSYGNPLVPFLTQNYRTVYAIDYRKYFQMDIPQFVELHDVDDVMFTITAAMLQGEGANSLLQNLC